MVRITIKPIRNWIGDKTEERKTARFELGYKETIKALDQELWKLGAYEDSVEIEMFIHPEDLRADGELRASARPFEPGVRLNFAIRSNGELHTVSYPCDTFDFWQDNLRAIAKSLEYLRHVSRYGVFKHQDMVSRLSLPSADGKLSSIDEAAEFIAEHSGLSVSDVKTGALKSAYRKAAARLHPDNKITGSRELFSQLVDFNNFLEKHFEHN